MLKQADHETNPRRSPKPRIWEIDFLRGLSIILMVFYHIGFDLSELCGIKTILGIKINYSGAFLSLAQYFFAGLFIILCGTSSTLSRSNIRRALKLIAVAIIITAVTYVYDSSLAVHFGILHCLAICILIYGLTLERAKPFVLAGVGAIVIGLSAVLPLLMKNMIIHFDWLLPLGITSPTYESWDYFPLLPWFGVFLVGTALGKSIYASKQSLIHERLPESFINAAGRHSLLIYMVHQPIIIAILYLARLLH